MRLARSASRIFWMMTCLAVWAAMRPRTVGSMGVPSMWASMSPVWRLMRTTASSTEPKCFLAADPRAASMPSKMTSASMLRSRRIESTIRTRSAPFMSFVNSPSASVPPGGPPGRPRPNKKSGTPSQTPLPPPPPERKNGRRTWPRYLAWATCSGSTRMLSPVGSFTEALRLDSLPSTPAPRPLAGSLVPLRRGDTPCPTPAQSGRRGAHANGKKFPPARERTPTLYPRATAPSTSF